eukprot:scaffold1771_cov172-Amphora_coffeaeformis.AAC.11
MKEGIGLLWIVFHWGYSRSPEIDLCIVYKVRLDWPPALAGLGVLQNNISPSKAANAAIWYHTKPSKT